MFVKILIPGPVPAVNGFFSQAGFPFYIFKGQNTSFDQSYAYSSTSNSYDPNEYRWSSTYMWIQPDTSKGGTGVSKQNKHL